MFILTGEIISILTIFVFTVVSWNSEIILSDLLVFSAQV